MNTNPASMSDWDLVVACLGIRSTIKLSREADLAARLLCDGMGRLSKSDLDPADYYPATDWSHVRDSSEAAVTQCAAYLRQHLAMDSLVRQANEALNRKDMVTYYQTLNTIMEMGGV
jgi:hypothetical protein